MVEKHRNVFFYILKGEKHMNTFKFVREYKGNYNNCWKWMKYKSHHIYERNERLQKAKKVFGFQKVIAAFVVDKGHKRGEEIHFITDKGGIYIFNRYTHKFITVLIARPDQVLRYFKMSDSKPHVNIIDLLALSKRNEQLGLNYY